MEKKIEALEDLAKQAKADLILGFLLSYANGQADAWALEARRIQQYLDALNARKESGSEQ